ncbi:MAG: hypothetical protein HUU23_02560 [Caldilineales bacterium]|nr:hypothetical protein [Caldilineales bacterium]
MTPAAQTLILLLLAAALFCLWRWRTVARAGQTLREQALAASQRARDLAQENAQRAAHLHALSQAGSEAIYLLDRQSRVLWWNQAAQQLATQPATPPLPLSRASSSFEVLDLVAQAESDLLPHERQFGQGGQTFHAVAQRQEGQNDLIVLSVANVTELQRLGRMRRDFVANISHDLRTPITAIQLMVDTLRSGAADSRRRQEQLLAGIADQTAILRQLAQELLDLSLIESGRLPIRLVPTRLQDLIAGVIQQNQPQAEHKGLRLHSAYDPQIQVLADVETARRALQNIVHNAIKFTPKGGQVRIAAESQGEDVRVAVQDDGPGIAPEDVHRIFERFYKADRTRSEGGTGLGLAIARHIVEGHGGRIWVESEPGRGATFFFTLLKA